MDLVSRADAMIAASNLRKILAGAPGISTGVLGGSGRVSTQKEINALVPDGYIAVVNSDTRGYTRMPNPTFSMAVGQSSMGKGQKTAILRKAQSKDKEVFTKNKKMISAVRKPVKVKKTNQEIENDNLSKGYIGGGSQMGRVNTSGGMPSKDMTSPPSISGVKWKKNDDDEYEAIVNGESYFFQRVEKKWRYYDDDMREYSLSKFKKLIEKQLKPAPAPAPAKPKPAVKKATKMGKSIKIKFDRDGGKWNTMPLEAVGNFKNKDIVFKDTKGETQVLRKYTTRMLTTFSHSGTGDKWAVRDPGNPNQYYFKDGFGYKSSRSFILIDGELREQEIDRPLSEMKVGYIL